MEYRTLNEADKRDICTWCYPGEYAVYDLPPYEEQEREKSGFCALGREGDYLGFWEDGALLGYVHMKEKPETVVIGIGLRPEKCGRGLGAAVLTEACHLAEERFPGREISLVVRTWNTRAVKCYEKAGFHIVGETFEQTTPAGPGEFYRMVKG